jgi:hypothetical protein
MKPTKHSAIVFSILTAFSAAGCIAEPVESEETNQESGDALSTTCGNLGQKACFSWAGGYCNYNLEESHDPLVNKCVCNPDLALVRVWAGPSLGCVPSSCMSSSTISHAFDALLADNNVGSITSSAVDNNRNSLEKRGVGWAIDRAVYVYRATSFQAEISYMEQNMKTLAKAYFRSPNWDLIGPSVAGLGGSKHNLALRLLATASSDMPKSQFSSAALTFDVAKIFAAPNAYVYALKVNPNSHILAINNCGESEVLQGELQFQIANGAVIKSLRRKKATGGDWEYLNASKTWVKSKCNQDSPRWQCPASSVKDEL